LGKNWRKENKVSDSFSLLFPAESCEDALRSWIEIRIRRQVPLQGGVSGASIYHVDAEVGFPGLQGNLQSRKLQCVIKYSSEESFETERKKFDDLPEELRKWFVDFATQRILVGGEFFMIMPYLRDYKTLAHIVYHSEKEQVKQSIAKVCQSLKEIHFYPDSGRTTSRSASTDIGKSFSLYLGSIQESWEKTERLVDYFPEIGSDSFLVNGEEYHPLRFYFERLSKKLNDISPPFNTLAHGDCHSRNLMLRPKDTDLKIIDIDKFNQKSDYIYDYGTLIADIETYNGILQARRPSFRLKRTSNGLSYTLPENSNSKMAAKLLRENVAGLAKEKEDIGWEHRLDLAKARYLLSMVSKTIDREQAFLVYCEGLKLLSRLA
jgi:hypothetical protein